MTPERWNCVKEIFAEALDRPSSTHAPYLDGACGADTELRREVERLLAQAGATLKSPTAAFFPGTPALSAGATLAQYRIEVKLGQGGMGSVYRAYDTRLQRQVALKILPRHQYSGAQQKELLMSEARAASALNHPNIVTVYEIGADRNVDFIAMEFVDGRSLAEVIPFGGLPVKQALKLAMEVASALQQAHAAGVVHRDLKPANVMLNSSGHVKLLDFGLAQRVGIHDAESDLGTGRCEIAGTPAYMSPEQAEGQRADTRSDVFSFGALLYHMLTGLQPFTGSSATSVMASVLRDDPAPLKDVPLDLMALVERCLQKDATRRFPHMGDVSIRLGDLTKEQPAPMVKPVYRRAVPAWAVGAMALLLAAAAVPLYRGMTSPPVALPKPPAPAPQPMVKQPTESTAPPAAAPSSRPAPPVHIVAKAATPASSAYWLEPGGRDRPPLRLAVINKYTGQLRDPSFSPEGTRIAFAWDGAPGNTDIYVAGIEPGATPMRLTSNRATEAGATWSPHGTKIAFRRLDGGSGIYMIPPSGGREEKVADALPLLDETLPHMSWTPDGDWLAAPDRDPEGGTQLFLYSVHGQARRQLTWNQTGIDHAPAISPDGRHLAYATCTAISRCDVSVVELDRNYMPLTREPKRLVNQGYIRGIAWMRDGQRLVYAAGGKDRTETYLFRVAVYPAGLPERLDTAGDSVRHPAISPKGDRLMFVQFRSDKPYGRELTLIENFR